MTHWPFGTDPRVIADDVWAKLLWAGLNLVPEDFPASSAGSYYPMELIRAVTLTWLFAGLRSDEVIRLPVGCVRWQHEGSPIRPDAADVLADDAVCLLDVPVHKTGTAFTKPVDPLLGQAIDAWQALRPDQPKTIDRKTGESVDVLFAVRAHPVARNYINRTIIPALCRKAGVPDADVRGKITSRRARSTIARQLYNAKEPMTLFELQAWLGHRTPASTQHYAKITPNTLAQAYSDAGYFARNVRTIEVLVDRDAVTNGTAAAGQPWQHYDLGHGYCGYTFFEQCPHRMACARCDFYTPKDSTKAQLLEAKDNLQRMLTSVPLTDPERAAVDDGQAAIDTLIGRLVDVPTPSGPTPGRLGIPPTVTLLPIVDVRQSRLDQLWFHIIATAIDLHSRAVVGWAIADHMRAELVTAALDMALTHRAPAAGVIFHSVRGTQYASRAFADYCTSNGIRRSLGRTGICYDNAVSESFFATYKKELIHTRPWPTVKHLSKETFDWIEIYYNTQRRHSTLKYLTPPRIRARIQKHQSNRGINPCP